MTFEQNMPQEYPSRLEAGTQNVHGIAGLGAGIDLIQEKGLDTIAAYEKNLTEHLLWELAVVGRKNLQRFVGFGNHTAVIQKVDGANQQQKHKENRQNRGDNKLFPESADHD